MSFQTPIDWKSEVWWRKRPLEERRFHLFLPSRIAKQMTYDVKPWDPVDTLIYGPPGTGKSIMAAEYALGALENGEVSARWVEADDYIEMLKDSFNHDGVLPEMYASPHLIKYIKGTFDVLVLDGLGEERLTEFAAHELGSLIRKRYDRGKITIITSSLNMVEIHNRYGKRLASALSEYRLELTSGR